MAQPQYGYAGQPPYQQQGGYFPQSNNPYTGGPPQPGFIPPPPVNLMAGQDAFVESGGNDVKSNFDFNNATIRAAFIRKVFFLVAIMLTVVTIMTAVPFFHSGMQNFVRTTPSLYWISYVVFLVVYLTLMCCESVQRSFPINLVATAILTLAIGYMTMMISSFHNIVSVLLCLAITTVCCTGIILFASQTKYDLTSMIGFVCIIGMVIVVFGIVAVVAAVFFKVRWMYTVYAGAAALLFMVYLAIDIQMIIGGKKYEISPEDHVFAAIRIFMDIVYIFWMLLSLFGSNK